MRILNFKAEVNFRDFGGYITLDGRQVKWGKLYRSATLSKLTDEDVPSVDSLGLNRVIDLRTEREIDREGYDRIYSGYENKYDFLYFGYGDPYLENAHVETELSWDMKQVDFLSIYVNMLKQNRQAIKQMFDRFADSSQYPILIHCTQGKDRTGIVAALLLLMLGVSQSVIMEDYMLTAKLIDHETRLKEMEHYFELNPDVVPDGVTANHWAPFFVCLPDSLEKLFTHLQKEYNGVTNFLDSVGVDTDQQAEIRRILVEEVG